MNDSNTRASGAPVRILIVDDHPNTATTLARALSQLGPGNEILTAESGEQALALVRDKTVDMLITDMVMPGINGLELIEKMQAHPGGRPSYTALVTAYDVPGLKESARRLKVNDVLNKPIRPERVCQIIAKAIEDMGHIPSPQKSDPKAMIKILVADDRPENVILLSRYLEVEGYICLSASDGDQAIAMTRSEMPDLVLLDVNMPMKDGFQALQEIRSDPSIAHIPVIILTAARLEPMDMQYALNIGADDYVTKPFDRRELMARIRTRLRVKETEDIIRQRNKELNLLPEIGRELSARSDVNELIDLVLRRTVETMGALLGHFILISQDNSANKTFHFSAPSAPVLKDELPDLTDLIDQVTENRQGIIISDAQNDTRWKVSPNDPTRAVVIVPMFGRLGLLGMLILAHEQIGYFQLEHKLLLHAIASQAAIAVENARLYSGVMMEQQRMAAVLQSAVDAILVFDGQGYLVLQNPAAENLFADGKVNLNTQLARGIGYDPFIHLVEAALSTRGSQSGEILWADKRVLSVLLTPLETGGCVAILQDVSRFKMLEQVKNDIIDTTTHGLIDPIKRISLISQQLSKAGTLNDRQAEYVDQIGKTVSFMDRLTQNLLESSQVDSNTPQPKRVDVDLNTLVSGIVVDYQYQAMEKKQTLLFERSAGEPMVQADPLQLQVAMSNLVNNSLKSYPENGSICVSVQKGTDRVTVNIKDNGAENPGTDLSNLFGGEKEKADSGMGLVFIRSIIEAHGGEVSGESNTNKGCSFRITLPLANIPLYIPEERSPINSGLRNIAETYDHSPSNNLVNDPEKLEANPRIQD